MVTGLVLLAPRLLSNVVNYPAVSFTSNWIRYTLLGILKTRLSVKNLNGYES